MMRWSTTFVMLGLVLAGCGDDSSETAEQSQPFALSLRSLSFDTSCNDVAVGALAEVTCALDSGPIPCTIDGENTLRFDARPGENFSAQIEAPTSTQAGVPMHATINLPPTMLGFDEDIEATASCSLSAPDEREFELSNIACTCLSDTGCQFIPSQGCDSGSGTSGGASDSDSDSTDDPQDPCVSPGAVSDPPNVDFGMVVVIHPTPPDSSFAPVELCTSKEFDRGFDPQPRVIRQFIDGNLMTEDVYFGSVPPGACIHLSALDLSNCSPYTAECLMAASVDILMPNNPGSQTRFWSTPVDLDCI